MLPVVFSQRRRSYTKTNIWTTVDSDFIGCMSQDCFVKGYKEEGWDGSLFLDRVNRMPTQFIRMWSEVQMVLIPINYKNEHWFLGVLMLQDMHLYIYDSLVSNCSEESLEIFLSLRLDIIRRVMDKNGHWSEAQVKRDITWSRVSGCPQQLSGSNDCGVFTCAFAQVITERCETRHDQFVCNFDGSYGVHFRLRFAAELYHQKLLVDNLETSLLLSDS